MTIVGSSNKIKPIAIVLPQFHPIPENNQWWGEGFTEWTNVVKGKPRFKGHYQPHLPKDIGYYDLRLPEAREAQAVLAKKFGVYGFCYYHYWFNGRRVLEKPVDAILESGKPDFPFMLCWANENWSRNWDGGFDEVLLEQNYSKEDFVNHARHLVKYFRDTRYIRVEDKPVFAIYKDKIYGDMEEYIKAFRDELRDYGIEIYLCRFERGVGTTENFQNAFSIFDAGIEFQPLTRQFRKINRPEKFVAYNKYLQPSAYYDWILRKLGSQPRPVNNILLYQDVVNNDLKVDYQQGWPIFPGVCPGWDNSSRRVGNIATILNGTTPEIFKSWVEGKINVTNWNLLPDRFIFVNAWNEWAEGNHLEPCERWGTQYLLALQQGVQEIEVNTTNVSTD
jgi:lipopolysaccharide biosynthesis protein